MHTSTAYLFLFLSVSGALSGCSDRASSTSVDTVESSELGVVAEWVSKSNAPIASPAPVTEAMSVAPVEDYIGNLEARLEIAPDDLDGWTLLTQSYAYVGRLSDARDAAQRAVALGADADRMDALIARAHDSY